MDYHILEGVTREHLNELVNKRIKMGWTPQGGVCVYLNYQKQETFFQAMIKVD